MVGDSKFCNSGATDAAQISGFANTGRALLGLFICRATLGMAAMPAKSVNKPELSCSGMCLETGLGTQRGEPENLRKWLVRKNRAADS